MTSSTPAAPVSGADSFVLILLPVWLVTAAWDFVCASALSVFAYHTNLAQLWRGVASTAFGAAAVNGGSVAVAQGIALHLSVALTWSAVFVVATRWWPRLRTAIRTPGGAVAVATAYGPIIWLVMSLVVIPLATGRPTRFGIRWWVQIFAHVPFVTLPLVFTARRMLTRSSPAIVSELLPTT